MENPEPEANPSSSKKAHMVDLGAKLWVFLNSNFGNWVYGMLLVGIIGGVYTNYHQHVVEQKKIAEESRTQQTHKAERLERLLFEFPYRLSLSLSKLQAADAAWHQEPRKDFYELRAEAMRPLAHPSGEQYAPLFPEFAGYSGLALFAEITSLVNGDEREELMAILPKLSGWISDETLASPEQEDAFKLIAGELLKRTKHRLWDKGFYYTDCKEDKPFC